MEKRKGGGARRGPFAGKRVPFATRLTDDTMEKLALAADKSSQSLSQKAEEAIILGLRQQDEFYRYFGPSLSAFEAGMTLCLPGPDNLEKLDAWEKNAHRVVDKLADNLHADVRGYASDIGSAHAETTVAGVPETKSLVSDPLAEENAEASRRIKRIIDVDGGGNR